jgi:hypothetical protein
VKIFCFRVARVSVQNGYVRHKITGCSQLRQPDERQCPLLFSSSSIIIHPDKLLFSSAPVGADVGIRPYNVVV